MRRVLILGLWGMLAGCGLVEPDERDELREMRSVWSAQAITSYTYTLRRGCFCTIEAVGPVAITVRDGQVESLRYVASGDPVTNLTDLWPTMDGLFDLIERAVAGDADDVVVLFHPDLGYPLTADIDYIAQAIDDELFLEVLSLTLQLAP